MSFSCLALNSSYSTFVENNGFNGTVVVSWECFNTCILLFNFSTLIGDSSFASKHAPLATNKCASSGTIVCSGVKCNVSTNLFLNSGKYVNGPPKNATFPLIGLPQANPDIVWFTTACKIDTAISSFAAPSFNNGCTSVFANTPHLDAIGYIVWYPFASSFNPAVFVFNNDAIWSKNAPVPPAHVPFIRCSTDLPK